MAAALGVKAELGIGATSTVDKPLEFLSETIAITEQFIDSGGITGSLSHPSERVARGTRMTTGTITMTPTPVELDALLPWVLGTAESSDLFALSDVALERFIAVDRTIKVPVYAGCVVQRATFSLSEGSPLGLSVDIMGSDETVGAAGSFPAIDIDITNQPYTWAQFVLSIGGTGYQFKDLTLVVDHAIEPQFFNSVTPTRFNKIDRTVSVSVSLPYGDAQAAYATALGGVAVVLTGTNANCSIVFSMAKVQTPRQSATAAGRGEIMLPWVGVARRSGTTAELVTTSDSTP